MSLEQLLGCHARLQRELANAFCAQPWPGARIERLADELAVTEAAIAKRRNDVASCGESVAAGAMLRSR